MQRKVWFRLYEKLSDGQYGAGPEQMGHFLDFGIETYESGVGWGHSSCALIEDLEGRVHSIPLDRFRFAK